jgi:hypothetical protein
MRHYQAIIKSAGGRRVRRWYQFRRVWLAALLLACVVWYVVPPTYSRDGIRFTVYHKGEPGALTFVVRDAAARPLPGVTVMSESESGTTQPHKTDATGGATIRPGETEVLAVFIDGHEFRLRPNKGLEYFAPSCSGGLTFQVSMN